MSSCMQCANKMAVDVDVDCATRAHAGVQPASQEAPDGVRKQMAVDVDVDC